MLDYEVVKEKLESKIAEYSKKKSSSMSSFYSALIIQLQKQLDNLNAKPQDYTIQDLIVAWQTYRECEQKRNLKFYTDNKWIIIGSFALVLTIGINIFYHIKNKKIVHG